MWILPFIIFITFALVFFGAYRISSIVRKKMLAKAFNDLELNSEWILSDYYSEPFGTKKTVTIISKQIGTDGETPWVLYKRQSGSSDIMKLETFLKIYRIK